MAFWRGRGREGGIAHAKFLAVWKIVQEFFPVGRFSFKNAKSESEMRSPYLVEFRNNVKMLHSDNFICRKFAVSFGKLQLSAPPTF